MGGPPDFGEDQESTVSISGPDKNASKTEKDAYDAEFNEFKKAVRELRKKYPRLKARIARITYTKRDPNDSFDDK